MVAPSAMSDILVYGNTVIDSASLSVMVAGEREYLAPREFLVLKTMIKLGRPLQPQDLQTDYPEATKQNIAVHLCRIRKKLRAIKSNLAFRAVRNRGYFLFVE